ncbi:F-box/kelch-repeat protein At3g23880-like [Cornus florida]|uniref:F-box/kelch-repeat protein At3g23880-like n=1 Tax=Cornus florida TaxID=4283 RepID=UPI0028965210|nr:F-box/kelch-repeat protein At3g23880-like [Cornus florida]
MTSNNDYNLLSKDVMTEILSRLPLKSLFRFRCVCNDWYTLIKASYFIAKNQQKNNIRLLVHHYDYKILRYCVGIFPDETLGKTSPVYFNLDELGIQNYPDCLIGPINGIYCVYGRYEDHMCLWNPATNEFRHIPLPRPDLPSYIADFNNIFGFGLDVMTNHYKVIWIRQFWDDDIDCPYDPETISVYNLCTNSWRLFDYYFDTMRSIRNSSGNDTYINGVYYWLTDSSYNDFRILAFDLNNENFRELPAPSDIPKTQFGELASYSDSIAIIIYHPTEIENYIDIWVMKGEGFWTKIITTGLILDILAPLGFWNDDHLFIRTRSAHLILYNINTLESRDLGNYGGDSALLVHKFRESLFSLKEGDNSFSMGQP